MIAELKSKLVAGRIAAALTLATLLSACGGGGGSSGAAGTPLLGTTPSGTSSAVASLSVAPAPVTLPNDGTATATITVTALDASNVTLKGVPISFSADSGTISPVGTVTDDKGELKATLGIGDNKTKRTITITAAAGGVSKTATIAVVDATATAPVATEITLGLDKLTINNTATDTVTATVTAKGEGGRIVVGAPISLELLEGASYVPSGTVTDANGVVTAVIRLDPDKRANRAVTVKAISGALSKSTTFQVTGSRITVVGFTGSVATGGAGSVTYRVADVNNSPMVGVSVSVSAAGLAAGTGLTNENGQYIYNFTAPATAGTVSITATAAGVSNEQSVVVGSALIPPASIAVASATPSAAPTVLRVNTANTNNLSQIKMLFLGANNVPVPNVRVRFDFDGNPAPNGSLSSGDALVYSDSRGIAVTNYRAGTAASPTDGVVVRACWSNTDFAAGICPPNSKTVKLTVVEEGLAVTIGTNDVIQEGATGLTYIKRYVVQVANASGAPVGSQQVTPQVDLPYYYKGNYRWNGTTWIAGRGDFIAGNVTRQLSILSCDNEDRNRNGAIELPEGDDLNGNGILEPRKSDVTVSMEGGTDKTNASGQVVLLIEYPKSHAGWVGVNISASADVRSPPASWMGILPVDAGALKRETPPPAFASSPYGGSGVCTDAN